MIGYRFPSSRSGLPLGPDKAAWLMPWVVALMVYVAGLSGAGLIVTNDILHASGRALATTLTLQVPAETSSARLDTVLALLRQTPGISSVHLLEPAETARLLEPWLGPAVPIGELPAPRLIDLRVDPGGGPDLAALRTQLATVVPEARLDDQPPWPKGVRGAAHRIEGVLAVAIVVAVLLVAASAAFAVRAAVSADRSTAELLHALGAADPQIARPLAIRALRLGLLGGVIGALAAILTIVVIGDAGLPLQLPPPGTASGIADWRIWAVMIGAALAAGLIAMASTWAAIMRRLALMP